MSQSFVVSFTFRGFCQGKDLFFNDKGLLLPESYKIGWIEAIVDDKLISDITIPGKEQLLSPRFVCVWWGGSSVWQEMTGIHYMFMIQ